MAKYTVTMMSVETDETTTIEVEGKHIHDAMEEALWQYGEENWILAIQHVEAPEDWDGRWVLTDTRGYGDVKYLSREEAIADADTGGEILIAVPTKR